MSEEFVDELRRAIENTTGCRKPQPNRKYHKHDEYLSYGLKASEFREILRPFRPRFLKLSLQERLDLAAKFLRDHVLPYIKELRRRGVSSTITLYAIRDLKGAEREEVLRIKKVE